jgi:competence protein ComEA
MPPDSPPEPTRAQRLLRRADQVTVAALVAFGLAALTWHWLVSGGKSGRLIEIDRAQSLSVQFKINVNTADWPEFATLPDVGETTARRIIDYRKRNGPFQSLDDLRQVRGIGPKTMERLRPYFLPIEPQVAEK